MRHIIKYLRRMCNLVLLFLVFLCFLIDYESTSICQFAILGFIGDIVSSFINAESAEDSSERALRAQRETNETNLNIARETNQANLDLYKLQYENSVKEWQREFDAQNAYNDPSAQVSRLRQAGLNPALSFGGVNTASSGSASLPSAAPAVGATVSPAPYDAYSDTWLHGFAESLPSLSESLSNYEDYKTKMIDNQTREVMNQKQLDNIEADTKKKLQDKDLSDSEKRLNETRLEGIELINSLNRDSYDDMLTQRKNASLYQQLQNQWLKDENARASERLVIDRLNAISQRALNSAQINSINGMLSINRALADLAANKDKREENELTIKQNLAELDGKLRSLNLDETGKQNAFNEVVRNSELNHIMAKDASAANWFAEVAFGFGLRDLGNLFKAIPIK